MRRITSLRQLLHLWIFCHFVIVFASFYNLKFALVFTKVYSISILEASFSLVIVTVVIQNAFIVAEIAQLGERQTEDLKVPGSNPANSCEFWIIPGLGKNFFSIFTLIPVRIRAVLSLYSIIEIFWFPLYYNTFTTMCFCLFLLC